MTFTDQATGPRQHIAAPGIPAAPPSSLAELRHSPVNTRSATPVLDVTIPVFNEEKDLEECLRRLHRHLQDTFPHPFRITVADNASTDSTLSLNDRIAASTDARRSCCSASEALCASARRRSVMSSCVPTQ